MIAKIAFLAAASQAQTTTVDVTNVPTTIAATGSVSATITGTGSVAATDITGTGSVAATTVTGTGSVAATTVTGTGSPSTQSAMGASFDPMTQWLLVNIGNCTISKFSNKDIFNLLDGVNQHLQANCGVTTTIGDVSDALDVCTLKLMTELESDYDSLTSCFTSPMEYTMMDVVYPVTLPEVSMDNQDLAVFTYSDFRERLEAGLDETLLNDESVARFTIDKMYTSLYSSFDDVIVYLNELMVKIEGMLSSDGSQSVEVVGIVEDDSTGGTTVVLRPIASDSESEADALSKLKSLINDPDSELNNMDGVVAPAVESTTVAPTSGMSTTSSAGDSTEEESGADWPLIGGLIGGGAGLAAIGGGAIFAMKQRKNKKQDQNSATLVPVDDSNTQVYTPNTKHGVEGLVDRTPRTQNYD